MLFKSAVKYASLMEKTNSQFNNAEEEENNVQDIHSHCRFEMVNQNAMKLEFFRI